MESSLYTRMSLLCLTLGEGSAAEVEPDECHNAAYEGCQ